MGFAHWWVPKTTTIVKKRQHQTGHAGICGILGSTYTGEYEDIEKLDDLVEKINKEKVLHLRTMLVLCPCMHLVFVQLNVDVLLMMHECNFMGPECNCVSPGCNFVSHECKYCNISVCASPSPINSTS